MKPTDLAVNFEDPNYAVAMKKVEMQLSATHLFNSTVYVHFQKNEWSVAVLRAVARTLSADGWDVSVVSHPDFWQFTITCRDPHSFPPSFT